jgi:hypothetical protein
MGEEEFSGKAGGVDVFGGEGVAHPREEGAGGPVGRGGASGPGRGHGGSVGGGSRRPTSGSRQAGGGVGCYALCPSRSGAGGVFKEM